MLKNRVFLIGLGAGIILGALLFQLMLSGEQSRQKLGQIGNESVEKLYTRVEVDALLKAERDNARVTEAAKQVEQPAVEAEPVKVETNEGKSDEGAPATETAEKKVAVKHVIQIKAGSGLAKTAELLAAQNIIDDQFAFVSHMKQSKKLVRAGYFLFQENITVDEAVTVVTGQPLTSEEVKALQP